MKIKYLIVQLGLFTLGSFLLNAIPKVKIVIRGGAPKIVRAGEVLKEDLASGGNPAFNSLLSFAKQISKLRNAKDSKVVADALEESQKLLGKIYPIDRIFATGNMPILPHQIGKTFSRKISNILIALADLKVVVSAEVGLAKSLASAVIFADMMDRVVQIIEKKNQGRQLSAKPNCTSSPDSFSCGLIAKDDRDTDIMSAAEKSGNFMLIYILDSLIRNDKGIFKQSKKIIESPELDLKNELSKVQSASDLDKFIKESLMIPENFSFEREFKNAVANFKKLAKLKK